MIDRKIFFAAIRETLTGGRLTARQVAGFTAILDEWERRALTDLRWLAYILATAWHETAKTMAPIAEFGRGRGRAYGEPDPATGQTYYGRGFVQLTWRRNYEAMGRLLGLDLVNHPDRAMDLPVAVAILFEGMLRGTFTGRKLADCFGAHTDDPVGARRIINGTDRAVTIAAYHRAFLAALQTAARPAAAPAAESPPPSPALPVPAAQPAPAGFFMRLARAAAAFLRG